VGAPDREWASASPPERVSEMKTDFGFEIRVLMCHQCGAPLEAATSGGSFRCEYCGVINHIVPRQTEAQLKPSTAQLGEAARMGRLWAQDGKPISPPASVSRLLVNGELRARKVKKAIDIFNSTRKEVESSSDHAASERLTFLTLVLYNHYVKENDKMRQRALLESAVEAFKLPHHKQFVLGILSRSAVKDGDLRAAKDWLKPCDPRSDDLRADTSYRVGQALIATAEERFDAVHALLGEGQHDVPIADGFGPLATVLRANAWEKRGRVDTARALFDAYLGGGGPYGLESLAFVRGIYPQLRLCQQTMPAA